MTSKISKTGSEPFLISSYTTQRNNKPVILELWGSKEAIFEGVIKDLSGSQITVIPPSSIYGERGNSITGSALLTYVKTTQLSPVLHTLGKKNIVWLDPSVEAGSSSARGTEETSHSADTIVNLEEEKKILQKILPKDFLEDVEQNYHTKQKLGEFGTSLFGNGSQALHDSCLPEAALWFKKALLIYLLLKDKKNIAMCNGNLGKIYYSLEEYQEAIQHHEKQLNIAKEIENRAEKGHAYIGLGNVYDSLEEYQTAIHYYRKHLQVAKKKKTKQMRELPTVILETRTKSLQSIKKQLNIMRSAYKL